MVIYVWEREAVLSEYGSVFEVEMDAIAPVWPLVLVYDHAQLCLQPLPHISLHLHTVLVHDLQQQI